MYIFFHALFFCLLLLTQYVAASSLPAQKEVTTMQRVPVEPARLAMIAGMLARYEIEARRLLALIAAEQPLSSLVRKQAQLLLQLGRGIVEGASPRLPQCAAYLAASLLLEDRLVDIGLAALEAEYHHDGALPKAMPACYHIKDLFVHPATVVVLVRDDPGLNSATKEAITAELTEVLAHTEIVRRSIIY